MTCRKARRLLPLAVGGDLSEKTARAHVAHLDDCPACRAEFDAFRAALTRAKILAREVVPGWKDEDWRAAVGRAVSGSGGPELPAARPFFLRPAVLAAASLALIAVAALLVIQARHVPPPRGIAEAGAARDVVETKPAAETEWISESEREHPKPFPKTEEVSSKEESEPLLASAREDRQRTVPVGEAVPGAGPVALAQGVLTATFISGETGLKIVWFFDRNFAWKGE